MHKYWAYPEIPAGSQRYYVLVWSRPCPRAAALMCSTCQVPAPCHSLVVLELKAVGGSRTSFHLEMEQFLHLQPWGSPGLGWASCPIPGLHSNFQWKLLDQHFWWPVQLQGSQLSHVSAFFSILSCWCFPGECVTTFPGTNLTITLWKANRDDLLRQSVHPTIASLASANLVLCPVWGPGLNDAPGAPGKSFIKGKKWSYVPYWHVLYWILSNTDHMVLWNPSWWKDFYS